MPIPSVWPLPRTNCWVRDNPQDKGAMVHVQPPSTHPICYWLGRENCSLGVFPTGPKSVFLMDPPLAPGAPAPSAHHRIPFAGTIPGESGGRKRHAGGGTGVRAGACICARQGEGSGVVSAGGVVSARHRLTGKSCRSRRKINGFTTVTIAVSSSLQSAPSC